MSTQTNTIINEDVKFELPKQYALVILNNNITPFGTVVKVLKEVFFMSESEAKNVMYAAHFKGHALCLVSSKPICDEKQTDAENYCKKMQEIEPVRHDEMMGGIWPSNYRALRFQVIDVEQI